MITAAQREQRRQFIGSSDVAALVGVDSFRNIGDVYLEKTGQLEPDKDSQARAIGTFLESGIIDLFEQERGVKTERNIFLSRDEGFPACANLDAAVMRLEIDPAEHEVPEIRHEYINAVVEAKSTSRQDEWGDRTGDVPLRVQCQVQWQMWVAACDVAWVPVLFPDFGRFRLEVYRVKRRDDLIEELVYRARLFWTACVLRKEPPPLVTPHLETLKRVRREPTSVVELNDEALEQWQVITAARAEIRRAEKEVEAAQARLLALLGDAEGGRLADGQMITYLEQNGQKNCKWDLLEAELRAIGRADLVERFVSQSRFRVLRLKKSK